MTHQSDHTAHDLFRTTISKKLAGVSHEMLQKPHKTIIRQFLNNPIAWKFVYLDALMEVGELRKRLIKSRSKSKNQDISSDDIIRAIGKLKILGNGFTLIPLGGDKYLVQSVPGELSMDQTVILQKAEANGGQASVSFLKKNLDWEEDRSNRALDRLLSDGLAWVDTQDSEKSFWIPSIFSALRA